MAPTASRAASFGILLTDGADPATRNAALVKAVDDEGAAYEVIAPKIAGATLSDGTKVAAKHKIDGVPSVLFDAVAALVSADGAALLAADAGGKGLRHRRLRPPPQVHRHQS